MFENTQAPQGGNQPEDMFAKVNTGGVSPVQSAPAQPPMAPKSPSNLPKILLIVGLALVATGALATGGYFLYASLKKPAPISQPIVPTVDLNQPEVPIDTNVAPEVNTNTDLNLNVETNTNTTTDANVNTNTNVAASTVDSDADGLTDVQEIALGTNPNSLDTDGDGLFDGEEVNIYKTDPLNPDTDGDGYKDGEEVANGYNPNGPGKLLQVPQAPTNTNTETNTNTTPVQ